jgi:5S rRNA maturation endonuclease (ribonuclease M5)/energy-coupling factor transporter ATP-binding protein EcfA2
MYEKWALTREHIYENEKGSPVAIKSIYKTADGKSAVWHRITPNGLVKGLTDEVKEQIPLYHIPQLVCCFDDERMKSEQPLFFTEGEKDCETLENWGYIATTTRNGGGSFPKWEEIKRYVSDFVVIFVLTDNDKTGQIYGINAIKRFTGKVNNVFIIDTIDIFSEILLNVRGSDKLTEHADISDLVELYGTETTQTALLSVVNARYRFGNTNPIYDLTPEEPKKIKDEKKKKKGNEHKIQNDLYDKIMNVLQTKPFIFHLSTPWLYENGIYCKFDLEKYINDQKFKYKIKQGTMNDVALNLRIHSKGLEVQPYETLICLKNGVYNFITGETEPHNKRYLFTYKFNEIGNSNAVQAFLEAFCDTPDKVGYFLGSCFYSNSQLEKCLFIVGDIGTGKSSIAKSLSKLFPENTTYLDLAKKYFDRFDLYGLSDSWLNIMDDVYINENNFRKIQSIISGVEVNTERKYGDPIKFKPRSKLLFTSNADPIFNRECEGMKRRSWFIHTRYCDNLPPEPSIADWLAYGLDYAKRLFDLKFKVNYQEDVIIHNPVKEFLDICNFPCPASEFYKHFIDWCVNENGGNGKRITSSEFYGIARKCGFERKVLWENNKTIRYWDKNQ